MSSTYGEQLKLSIFGQSHGPAIGFTLDGIPAGLPVDFDALQSFLNRRAPGQNDWTTPRKEEDLPEFLGGIVNGFTCGAPIAAVIYNHNTRSSDYTSLKTAPRPGHADYTAQVKYGGHQDYAGGGHFSGRLTAPLCIAGGLCKQWLAQSNIHIRAHILQIGNAFDTPFDPCNPDAQILCDPFSTIDPTSADAMKKQIDMAKSNGDSIGGMIECAITGLPAGIGDPMFGGIESKLASIVYGIPAIKSLSFGAGDGFASMRGSEANDPFYMDDNKVKTKTNNCGGILGGISNGMPVIFRATVKPTPSISLLQQTVDLSTNTNTSILIKGRHDPCIVPRAVPVIEAAAAIAIYDMILAEKGRS